MNRFFVYTSPFRTCCKAMGLSDIDLFVLEEILLDNPQKGAIIEVTGDARKLRISLNDIRWKSSYGPVIYLDVLKKNDFISFLHIRRMYRKT